MISRGCRPGETADSFLRPGDGRTSTSTGRPARRSARAGEAGQVRRVFVRPGPGPGRGPRPSPGPGFRLRHRQVQGGRQPRALVRPDLGRDGHRTAQPGGCTTDQLTNWPRPVAGAQGGPAGRHRRSSGRRWRMAAATRCNRSAPLDHQLFRPPRPRRSAAFSLSALTTPILATRSMSSPGSSPGQSPGAVWADRHGLWLAGLRLRAGQQQRQARGELGALRVRTENQRAVVSEDAAVPADQDHVGGGGLASSRRRRGPG